MYGCPTVTRRGPRSLHFRGRRPIPRLPELASSSARPAAAIRDEDEDTTDDYTATIAQQPGTCAQFEFRPAPWLFEPHPQQQVHLAISYLKTSRAPNDFVKSKNKIDLA